MTIRDALTAELRLLYEYGEASTFARDADRILSLIDQWTLSVTLADALDQAGVQVHRVLLEKKQR